MPHRDLFGSCDFTIKGQRSNLIGNYRLHHIITQMNNIPVHRGIGYKTQDTTSSSVLSRVHLWMERFAAFLLADLLKCFCGINAILMAQISRSFQLQTILLNFTAHKMERTKYAKSGYLWNTFYHMQISAMRVKELSTSKQAKTPVASQLPWNQHLLGYLTC